MLRRLDSDRGAVAVIVALLLPVLLGFVALALDLAGVSIVRGQVQNGVDAAALAIAQECATGQCPPDVQVLVEHYVSSNTTVDTDITYEVYGGQVWVAATTQKKHVFAPVIGLEATPVAASAAAVWEPTVRLVQ